MGLKKSHPNRASPRNTSSQTTERVFREGPPTPPPFSYRIGRPRVLLVVSHGGGGRRHTAGVVASSCPGEPLSHTAVVVVALRLSSRV